VARKPRIHNPGGIYHAMLRGNGGQNIFNTEEHNSYFCILLNEIVFRNNCRIHGFCLMTNHVHLIIQVGEIPLSKIMQNLSFRFTRWVNKKEKRFGHLFQGRYKAILVEADQYLTGLVRYVHLNPVRSGLVKDPADYNWSGHRAYMGKDTIPWLTIDFVLSFFGKRLKNSREKYTEFVLSALQMGHQDLFYGNDKDSRVLGNDRFIEQVTGKEIQTGKISLERIIKIVCEQNKITEKELKEDGRNRKLSEYRGIICWLAKKNDISTLSKIGVRFNRDITTLSRMVNKIDKRVREDKNYGQALLQYYNNAIMQA
jgi:REP element-mobilizing transposase RayT